MRGKYGPEKLQIRTPFTQWLFVKTIMNKKQGLKKKAILNCSITIAI